MPASQSNCALRCCIGPAQLSRHTLPITPWADIVQSNVQPRESSTSPVVQASQLDIVSKDTETQRSPLLPVTVMASADAIANRTATTKLASMPKATFIREH